MATANIIQTHQHGVSHIQAVPVPALGSEVLTFSTAATSVAFDEACAMVTIGVTAAAYLAFGDADVTVGLELGEFDAWQPANTIVSYPINRDLVSNVVAWDGSS